MPSPGPRGNGVFDIPCHILGGAVVTHAFPDVVLPFVVGSLHGAVGLHLAAPVYPYGVVFVLRVPYPHKTVQQYAKIWHGCCSGGNGSASCRVSRRAKDKMAVGNGM